MPNWKKVIVSGSDASLNSLNVTSGSIISGSLNVNGGITGSLLGTASFASTASYWSGSIINAQTASYVVLAQSASYWSGSIQNAISSSYALTASFALNSGGGGTSALFIQDEGITQGSASYLDFIGDSVTATVTNGTASITISGGGSGTAIQGASVQFSQPTPATTWSINHAINSRTPVVEVYDSNYNVIIPTGIQNPAPFQTKIYFDIAQSGYAVISTGGVLSVSGSNAILNQNISSSTWTFNHQLNNLYPVFTIFDSNDDVIIPQRIHVVDTGSAVIYFSSPRTGTAVASVAGNQTFALSSSLAATASLALTAISSSYASTASFVTLAQTASFVTLAQTASFVTTAQTASFVNTAQTASFVTTAQTASFVTLAQSASFVLNAQSASYWSGSINNALSSSFASTASYWSGSIVNAATASFVANAQTASFVQTSQTASFVTTAQTASFVTTAQTASFVQTAQTASFVQTAQTASFVANAQTASFVANAQTASFANNFTVAGTLTAQTLVVQTITSSVIYSSGSNKFGNDLANIQQLTGSVTVTGSLAVNGSNVVLTNQTASMSVATASFASTASYWSGSINNAISSSFASTASYWSGSIVNAATASFVQTAQTASFVNLAQTASFVTTAQSASYWSGSITNAATASFVQNAVSSSFAATASFALNSGGGISAISIADEGVLFGSASYFNFIGAGVTVAVASNTASFTIPGGGGSGTQGLTTQFTQSSAAVSWSFTHNLNTRTPVVQVYDSTYNQITPQYISSSDASTVVIGFGVATTGYAVVSTGGTLYVTGSNVILNQTASAATWSFNHGLNTQYPIFQVFDSNNEVIIPTTIRAVDSASALIYFPVPVSGKAVASLGGVSGSGGSGAGFPFSGSAVITGSFLVSGSFADFTRVANFTGSLTGSLLGTASFATTASYATFALTASTAPGYTVQFTQSVAAATWSFNHNMNTRNPIVQVYDSSYKQIIPNDIVGTSVNTAEIRFDYATTGYVVMSNGGGLYVTGSTSQLTQTSAATTWSFTHNLNSKYVNFEVYDSNDYVIIPAGIRAIDVNTAELHFAGATAGKAVANFSGINGAPNATTASYALTSEWTGLNGNPVSASLGTAAAVSTTVVASTATGSYYAAFFDYAATSGSNSRAGTVMSVWNSGSISYNEVTTNDIGNTSQVTMSVDLSGANVRLKATTTTQWTIRSLIRLI